MTLKIKLNVGYVTKTGRPRPWLNLKIVELTSKLAYIPIAGSLSTNFYSYEQYTRVHVHVYSKETRDRVRNEHYARCVIEIYDEYDIKARTA